MAGESAELLRRIDGLQEELRLLSDRVVKFETLGILQELRMLSDRVASLETTGIQQEQVVVSASPDPTAEMVDASDAQRLEAGMFQGASEETEQFRTRRNTAKSVFFGTRNSRKLTARSVIATESEHELQESFWDALLVAGLDEIGPAGTAVIAFGVLASFGLQLLFVWIVFTSFLGTDAKYDVNHLRDWRLLYGHSLDSSSGASRVSKICGGALFEREWWHSALLDEVDAYLLPVFPGTFPDLSVGVVLSSIALAIWACYIAAELQDAGRFAWSIFQLPRGNTVITAVSQEDRVFESVSCLRRIMVFSTVLARLAIAVMLGITGGLWLAYTRDITDIMLNAVALLFILEIDELLYKVLASKHTMKYLSSVRTLQLGQRKTWAGVDVWSMMRLLLLVVVTAIFIQCTVCQNAIQAKAAFDSLCGGNLDFVYSSHPQMGPIMVMDTKPFDLHEANWLPGIRQMIEDVVLNYDRRDLADIVTWRLEVGDRKVVAQVVPKHFTQIFTAYTKLDAINAADNDVIFSISCEDRRPSQSEWEWSTVTAMTGATNCREAQPFCDNRSFPLVRMVCPETCGCTVVDSGILIDTGCKQRCQNEMAFKASQENASCLDYSMYNPDDNRSEPWRRFWQDWGRMMGSLATNATDREEMQELFSMLAITDCSFIEGLEDFVCHPAQGSTFSGDNAPMKVRSASWACPETCGCSDQGRGAFCPKCGSSKA